MASPAASSPSDGAPCVTWSNAGTSVAGSIGALAAILNGVRTSGVTRSESTGRPDLARVVWTTIDRG